MRIHIILKLKQESVFTYIPTRSISILPIHCKSYMQKMLYFIQKTTIPKYSYWNENNTHSLHAFLMSVLKGKHAHVTFSCSYSIIVCYKIINGLWLYVRNDRMTSREKSFIYFHKLSRYNSLIVLLFFFCKFSWFKNSRTNDSPHILTFGWNIFE